MRSLGETIRDKRKKVGFKRSDLERETKIKKDFLEAIESGAWDKLPEFPVVQGFVRSIAHVLEIDEPLALALLRRDYPQKKVSFAPKPDVKNKFIWTPKWTLLAGSLFVTLLIAGYLGYQYKKFVSPPDIVILKPKEEEIISASMYVVEGRTNLDATVIVNNQPTVVSPEGLFAEEVEVTNETKEIVVKATSRSGKVTEVKRKIQVEN